MASSSSRASPAWPPHSIAVNTENIIDECESMEMAIETASQPFLAVVQMAALLFQGELIHSRHLWRRMKVNTGETETKAGQGLGDWWQVGRCMLEMNITGVWDSLQICASHPFPISQYATEVARSYRLSLLHSFRPKNSAGLPNLGLTPDELSVFLKEQGWVLEQNVWVAPAYSDSQPVSTSENLTQVLSFLETTKLNV